MIKKFLLGLFTFTLLTSGASAALQLDDTLKPQNLPGLEVQDAISDENPETAATQTLAIYVGGIISKVLLYSGAITVIFLIVSGSQYILAFGKDEKIEKGKRGVFWSLIGLLLIMFSYAIVQGVIQILLTLDAAS